MTLTDIFVVMGLLLGFCLGVEVGMVYFGPLGALGLAILLACLGGVLGVVPEWWGLYRDRHEIAEFMEREDTRKKTIDELRRDLRDPRTFTVGLHLLALRQGGEDIAGELPFVLDMLGDEDRRRRGIGYGALLSAFPDLAAQIAGYCYDDPPDECRRKLEPLRRDLP